MASSPMALALSIFRRLPVRLRRAIVRTVAPTFVVGVVAIVRSADGKLLLLRERHHNGWALPGGLLDRGEEPPAALVRELREEIAVVLSVDSLAEPLIALDAPARRVDVIFQVTLDDGVRPSAQEPEVLETRWFDLGELPELFEPTVYVLQYAGVFEPRADF